MPTAKAGARSRTSVPRLGLLLSMGAGEADGGRRGWWGQARSMGAVSHRPHARARQHWTLRKPPGQIPRLFGTHWVVIFDLLQDQFGSHIAVFLHLSSGLDFSSSGVGWQSNEWFACEWNCRYSWYPVANWTYSFLIMVCVTDSASGALVDSSPAAPVNYFPYALVESSPGGLIVVSFEMCLPCLLAVHYVASSVGAIVDYSRGALVESECNDGVCLLCRRVCSAVLHPSTFGMVMLCGRRCFRFC